MTLLAVVTFVGFAKVVTFLVMLSVLIVLHELGHFVLARRNGVHVNEFAVGFGPRLAGWTSPRSGTQYSLRALPIGGFCAMEGEDNRTSEADAATRVSCGRATPRNLTFRPSRRGAAWRSCWPARFANFLLCYLILLVGALAFGVASDKAQPVVGEVLSGSPAAIAGIRPGDRIVAIDNVGDHVRQASGRYDPCLARQAARSGVRTQRHAHGSVRARPFRVPPQVGKSYGCIGFQPVPAYERVGVHERHPPERRRSSSRSRTRRSAASRCW